VPGYDPNKNRDIEVEGFSQLDLTAPVEHKPVEHKPAAKTEATNPELYALEQSIHKIVKQRKYLSSLQGKFVLHLFLIISLPDDSFFTRNM